MKKILLLFLFLAVSCTSLQDKSDSIDYAHIKVIQVIDGDTVRLENGELLRYIGIDTPELRRRTSKGWNYAPSPFALEAKEFNKRLVEGKYVRIEFDVEKRDSYGRLLGYVFLDDLFVNAKLLEEGLAVIYTRPPNVKYVDLFLKLQRKARKEKKGLWGSYEVIESTQASRFIGQIRTVRGRVLKSYTSKNCVFLNFGEDWRNDFTVVIFKNSLKYFKEKGIDPSSFYVGKTIEVTGRIRDYNGPEIIVNFPEEIIIISSDE